MRFLSMFTNGSLNKCNSPDLPDVEDLDARISRTYFLEGAGFYRYICVSALLALEERLHDRRTHVQSIWTFILHFQNFEE